MDASSITDDPAACRPDFRALRVLVVDDIAVNRELILRMLERMGIEADATDNGLSCVELHDRRAYDLILLDVEMPGLCGLETARTLRREQRGGKVPHIVAITALTGGDLRERLLEAGMDDYLPKPFRSAELRTLVCVIARDASAPRPHI